MKSILRAAGIFLGFATLCSAQTDVWTAASGNWSSPPDWSLGSPANNGTAQVYFDIPFTFSSTVDNSWSIASLDVGSNAGAFTLMHTGSHTLTIGTSFTDNSSNQVHADVALQGAMTLSMLGTGTLTLTQLSSYTGGTALSSGTLADGLAHAFSSSSAFAVGSTSTLDVNYNETIASLADNSGGGTVDLASGALLTMGGSATTTFSGAIAGAGGVDVAGTSTLTLSGTSTYSGATEISSGATLVVGHNGALGSSAVSLLGGATLNLEGGITVANTLSFSGTGNVLTGGGTVGSAVVVGPAVVLAPAASPGGGPGDLTFSSGLTIANGGTLSFKLYDATGAAGTGYALITATGGLNLTASAGMITFDLLSVNASGNPAAAINFNPANAYAWKFAASGSAIAGFSASQFNLVTTGFNNSTAGGSFSFSEVGNNLFLDFTPVPEPATWAMLLAGVALAGVVACRRRTLQVLGDAAHAGVGVRSSGPSTD
jgi:autotransporter-associated beta strand protein